MGRWVGAAVLAVVMALSAQTAHAREYRATIERTTGGFAHVTGADHGSMGFGYGFAYAQDQLCTFADIIVTVNAERSRYFGPEGTTGTLPATSAVNNLASDFFFQRIKDRRTVERLVRRPYPHGPSRTVRATVRGFVAGYNRYLRRTGLDRLPDPRCRGAAHVRPITELDLYRRFYQLGVRASSGNFLREIVAAQPPTDAAAARAARAPRTATELRERLSGDPVLGTSPSLGSNGWGVGGAMSATGRGVVLGNPHFPWQGSERWYEVHLRVPGKLDAIGAALQGAPVVNIGFNRNVAWTHTVSTARRFTPYELRLAPGDPTSYVVDGQTVPMRRRTVEVRLADGSVRSHTFYETRWGPVFSLTSANLTWTRERAFALADVNANHFRITNQWPLYDTARSVGDLRRANARVQGNPWTNTIAADRRGRAYYADESVTPHVTAELQERCSSGPLAELLLAGGGLILLDGSRSECAWGRDRDAVAPGILGPRNQPRLQRRDYVLNANDSYSLSNARAELSGFPRILGAARTERSLRTRLNLLEAERLRAQGDVTRRTLQRTLFRNRVHSAELGRDAVVEACRAARSRVLPDGRVVDLTAACDVLAAWDLRADVDSRGMVLWRETWDRIRTAGPAPWRVAFDPADPLGTPNGLDASRPIVLDSLAAAVQDLRDKGIALDVPFGQLQAEPRGERRIPIHGCNDREGCMNVITAIRDPAGRYDPYTGTSFVMTVEFDRRGRPRGEALLSYSQSENPRSRHFADQTELYSRKRWLPMRFTRGQIRRDPDYRRSVVRGED